MSIRNYALSEGALQVIRKGGYYNQPIMQVLRKKKISSSTSKELYSILLSDGNNSNSLALLSTQINDEISGADGIPVFSVIKIKKYKTAIIHDPSKGNTWMLVIKDFNIIALGEVVGEIIGSSTALMDTGLSKVEEIMLSEGALQVIINGYNYNQPIMQVLGSEKITSSSADKEQYRILLSDGKNSISFAMLTTQIGADSIPIFSVIKIERYIRSVINSDRGDTRMLLIVDFNIIALGEVVGEIIGSPTALIDTGSSKVEEKMLSEGALQVITRGGDCYRPIMQVLGSKKVIFGRADKEQYLILLSDGKNLNSLVLLFTQIGAGGIPVFSVITIDRYITINNNPDGGGDMQMLIILDFNIIALGEVVGEKIGSPTALINTESSKVEEKMLSEGAVSGEVVGETIGPHTALIATGSSNIKKMLSEGALQVIMKGGDCNQPIMQVLGSKRITFGGADKERYRILLSDGMNSSSFAMLSAQIGKVGAGGIPMFSIIKILSYRTSVIDIYGTDMRVMIIFDMNIIVPGEEVGGKIGSPTALVATGSSDQTCQ